MSVLQELHQFPVPGLDQTHGRRTPLVDPRSEITGEMLEDRIAAELGVHVPH